MVQKLMSVVVLNWNRLRYSKQTIKRLIETATIPIELIIVDNNSYKESGIRDYYNDIKQKLEKRFDKVIFQFNNKNLGVAGGRNSGLVHATGEYLMTLDDDVLVPDKWDTHMATACDKIPQLGITGVNVEPFKFPVREINGVKVRPKSGNLGGACLCLPRRVFKRVGYYNYFTLYGHEDAAMHQRLKHLGLMSAYIMPKGIHLDKDSDIEYRKAKTDAHKKGSIQLKELSKYVLGMRKTGDVYVPFDANYRPPDADIFTNELIMDGRKI